MVNLKHSITMGSAVLIASLATSSFASYGLPATPAPIQSNNWYVAVFGGVGFTPDTTLDGIESSYDIGWDVGGEVGYRSGPLRYEGEYIFQRSKIDTLAGISTTIGSIKINAGMFNVLYSFGDVGARFNPYLGGGIGYANVDQTSRSSNGEFGYQARAGLVFNILDTTAFTVEYRYFGTTEASNLGKRFQNHMINGGLIYYID